MALGKEFFKNTFKIAGSAALAQGIGILTIHIFARLFTPEIVGQYALFTSLVGILAVFGSGRYELALMLPQEKKRAIDIMHGSMFIALLWSVFLFIIVLLGKDFLLRIGNYGSIESYVIFIPLAVLFTCWNRILLYWFNRNKQFGKNALLNIFNSGGTKIVNVGVGVMGFISVASLIFVNLFILFGEFLWRSIICFKDRNVDYCSVSYYAIKRELIRYKKFPLIDTWNGLLDTGSLLIVPILLSIYFSDSDVGLYSQSLTLVQLPLALIASALGQVLFQRLSEAKHNGEIGQVVSDSFVLLLQIGVPVFLIIFLWGKELFAFFLGDRWAMSGKYAEMLAPWCCLKLCFSPLSLIFSILERQGLSLFLTILIIITRIVAIIIGGIYSDIYLSILLFGISGVLVNVVGIFFVMILSKQKWSNLLNALRKSPLDIVRE